MASNKMKGVVSRIDKQLDTIAWEKRMQSYIDAGAHPSINATSYLVAFFARDKEVHAMKKDSQTGTGLRILGDGSFGENYGVFEQIGRLSDFSERNIPKIL